MTTITIPFSPRPYQQPLVDFLLGGGKKAFVEWHRRAGKDLVLWNLTVRMASQRKGLYYYFLPTYTQAKKIIWDGITNDGLRFINFVPTLMVAGSNSTEMKLSLKNGSIVQLIGTDNYDTIRGTNPVGCVFSEYAYQNPMAWEVVRPILRLNGGWAVFNTTPNGKNHSHDLGEMAKENEDWFYERLSITDTGLLTEADMDLERKEGMSEEMIKQEYYCSHDVGTQGAYYADLVFKASQEARICAVPYDKALGVDLYLDLGKSDSTSILFVQTQGKEIRLIDFYEDNGKEVADYIRYIKDTGYSIDFVCLPHDAFAKRLESPRTIAKQFEDAGFKVKRVPNSSIQNGINQVRKIFSRIWFDTKCKQLVRALENYHKEYDPKRKAFRPQPYHDWSSHAADAMRYLAMGLTEVQTEDQSYMQAAKSLMEPVRKPEDIDDFWEYEEAVKGVMGL